MINLLINMMITSSFLLSNIQTTSANFQRIPLQNIDSLTFNNEHITSSRRTHPIKQLDCVGGNANCPYWGIPSTVQCINKGSDGINIQWECQAELNSKIKFGRTDVSCEGYDHPDDPYILINSCGLKYTLEWTDLNRHQPIHHESEFWGSLLIIGGIIFMIVSCCQSSNNYYRDYTPGFWTGALGGYALSNMSRNNRGYYTNRTRSPTRISRGFGTTKNR